MRIYPGTTVDYEFKTLGDLGHTGSLNDRQFKFLRASGYTNALPDMFRVFVTSGGGGGAAAVLSGLSYVADLISVTTDTASGAIYYLLHNSVTPLSGSAIKAAVIGLTAVGGGTLDPLETADQPVDWTLITPGTYWINMVQESAGGFSNVVFLEVTLTAAGITRVGVGTGAYVSGTSLTVPLPTGMANGDYIVLVVNHRETFSLPNTPAGWTMLQNNGGWSGGSPSVGVYGRVRNGSEGSDVTITFAGTTADQIGFTVAYRGVSGPGNVASISNLSTASMATPTLTATADSCILHIWANSGSASPYLTMPNAGDLIQTISNPGTTWNLGAENQFAVGAGTTSARTATSSAAINWNAVQIELLA